MQAYSIDRDLSFQRGNYLKGALIASVVIGITLAGLSIATASFDVRPWVGFVLTLLASNEFRRREHLPVAAWLFLVGLLLTMGLSLYVYGPNTPIYFLMSFPVVLGALLLDQRSLIRLALFCCLLMFGLTAWQTNVASSISLTFAPCLFCLAMT